MADRLTSAPAPDRRAAPLTLVLPYAVLVGDNGSRRLGVVRGRIVLSARYRAAKAAGHTLALALCRSCPDAPFPRPHALSLTATVYPPDRRRRDLLGIAKITHDLLQGAAYDDDAQLADVHYVRGPVDRERPRVELVIAPLTP